MVVYSYKNNDGIQCASKNYTPEELFNDGWSIESIAAKSEVERYTDSELLIRLKEKGHSKEEIRLYMKLYLNSDTLKGNLNKNLLYLRF